MYGKIFEQMYDSSIAEDWQVMVVFQQLIVLADPEGVVDRTPSAISRRTNIPQDIIERAIDSLSQPDPSSRSDDEGGRRVVLLDEHRNWGWRIVNHKYYRDLASAAEKRAADRDRKRDQRATSDKKNRVYFITDGRGNVKVGFSKNPWSRAKDLQCGSAAKLSVAATVAATGASETNVHDAIRAVVPHVAGEWFKSNDVIDRVIEAISSKKLKSDNDVVAYVADYVATTRLRSQLVRHTDTDTEAKADTNTKAPLARIPSAIERGFGEFWERVHRKEGKGAAKNAYAKAIARVQQERDWNAPQAIKYLNERMTQFASSPQARDEVKGTLHPATWLNQARYDDDADIWTQGQSEDATREAAAQAANAAALKRREEARKRLAERGEA